MKFFFYSSIVFIMLAAGLALLAIAEHDIAFLILYIQFGLGCMHLLSTLFALSKFGLQKPWFVIHLIICLIYLSLLFVASPDLDFGVALLVTIGIVFPWIIGIVHTFQLYKSIAKVKTNILDI